MLAVDDKWSYYEKRPEIGYYCGINRFTCKKRYLHARYDLYHFFVPNCTMSQAHDLRIYFRKLDSLTSAEEAVHRWRETDAEVFDTAIDVLNEVYLRLEKSQYLEIGSQHICPIAFAVIGRPQRKINCRLHLKNMNQLVDYYEKLAVRNSTQFNIMRVYKRPYLKTDRLKTICSRTHHPINQLLVAAIGFLHDIVRHCGPDSDLFEEIYSNYFNVVDVNAWRSVQRGIFGTPTVDISYPVLKTINPQSTYSEVEIIDLNGGQCYSV